MNLLNVQHMQYKYFLFFSNSYVVTGLTLRILDPCNLLKDKGEMDNL